MELIRHLADLSRVDLALAGGKGAQLGELVRAGLLVPPGFVLLTTAYETFVTTNDLQGEIERLAGEARLAELSRAESASVAIRERFERAELPTEIAAALGAAYANVGAGPVAVRSSATVEDQPDASFAGQQETFLNVVGTDQLLAAVRRCWSSFWTARAIAYRAALKLDPTRVRVAVVVQQMVRADSAGVLFTVNPITGARDELVINAAWGLGDAIVGGRVNPDTIEVNKSQGTITRLRVGEKDVMTVPADLGTVDVPVELAKRGEAVLTTDQIGELARIARVVEAHFGCPQDVEWAIAGRQVYVVQSRPITTLPTEMVASRRATEAAQGDDTWDRDNQLPAQPFDLWTRTNVGENLPYPITPLTETAFPVIFGLDQPPAPGSGPQFQAQQRFYGRLYINEGGIMQVLSEEYGLPGAIIDRMWGSRRRGKHRATGGLRPLRLVRKLPSLIHQARAKPRNPEPKQTSEQFFAQIDTWIDDFAKQDRGGLDDRALWAEGLPIWRKRGARVWSKNMAIGMSAAVTFAGLERLVAWWTGQKEWAHDLVTGLTGIYSAEVGPALWQMAESLRAAGLADAVRDNPPEHALALLRDTAEAKQFRQLFVDFLQRHGHRCPNEVELLFPRWADAPEQIVALVASYLRVNQDLDPRQAELRQRQRRETAVRAVVERLGPIRRAIFRYVLGKAQQAVRSRDNSRYYVIKFYYPLRQTFAEMGRRWAERGWLGRPDDVFFLTLREIEAIVAAGTPAVVGPDVRTLVANRRVAHDHWYHVIAPDVIGPDGVPIEEAADGEDVLRGVPASGGQARGSARLIDDPREAMRLGPGDILVTQATDPGWTPVFPLVRGIVLELGGQLSHGAIVAREYGIPAVVNVSGARRRIRDGQTIVVDGTAGQVYLSDPTGQGWLEEAAIPFPVDTPHRPIGLR